MKWIETCAKEKETRNSTSVVIPKKSWTMKRYYLNPTRASKFKKFENTKCTQK